MTHEDEHIESKKCDVSYISNFSIFDKSPSVTGTWKWAVQRLHEGYSVRRRSLRDVKYKYIKHYAWEFLWNSKSGFIKVSRDELDATDWELVPSTES